MTSLLASTKQRCFITHSRFPVALFPGTLKRISVGWPASLLTALLILLCPAGSIAQGDGCTLKLAQLPDAPELLGFRMGMTKAQVKVRVPQVDFGRINSFGVSKTSISPDYDSRIDKTTLGGVRTVSLDFLDDRLVSLWFGYDSGFKWHTVPDFVNGISQSLQLPNAWQIWKMRGQQLKCADFQITVINIGEGPAFHIIDETAEQLIAARRAAIEEENASAADAVALEVIGDKKDKFYYVQGCAPAHEIKREDRVIFKSKEEAQSAGYKPATKCE